MKDPHIKLVFALDVVGIVVMGAFERIRVGVLYDAFPYILQRLLLEAAWRRYVILDIKIY